MSRAQLLVVKYFFGFLVFAGNMLEQIGAVSRTLQARFGAEREDYSRCHSLERIQQQP